MAYEPNTNFGKIQPTPSLPNYVPPTPIPILVKNPFGLLQAQYIYAFKTNHLGNHGGSMADEWNKVMDELEKLNHPRTKELMIMRIPQHETTTKQQEVIRFAHEVLSWIKAGGDNVVCNSCQAKSDRFTNYVTEHGHPIDINYNIQPNNKRQRLLCKECYENQKMEYAKIRLMREQDAQRKKEEEEERNRCSCAPPLSQCGNCIHKMREAYKNDPRPACEKCHSKDNTSVLKFGDHYHRTCDDCIEHFEADNSY